MEFAIAMEDNLERRRPRVRREAGAARKQTRPAAAGIPGVSEETARVLQTITVALRPFPEAREAVVAALQAAEGRS